MPIINYIFDYRAFSILKGYLKKVLNSKTKCC